MNSGIGRNFNGVGTYVKVVLQIGDVGRIPNLQKIMEIWGLETKPVIRDFFFFLMVTYYKILIQKTCFLAAQGVQNKYKNRLERTS